MLVLMSLLTSSVFYLVSCMWNFSYAAAPDALVVPAHTNVAIWPYSHIGMGKSA